MMGVLEAQHLAGNELVENPGKILNISDIDENTGKFIKFDSISFFLEYLAVSCLLRVQMFYMMFLFR